MSYYDADGAPKSYLHAGLAQAAYEEWRDGLEPDVPPCDYCGRTGRTGHRNCGE